MHVGSGFDEHFPVRPFWIVVFATIVAPALVRDILPQWPALRSRICSILVGEIERLGANKSFGVTRIDRLGVKGKS